VSGIEFLLDSDIPIDPAHGQTPAVALTVEAHSALCDAALSEAALSADWLRDEEEAAWANF
jgi:hypothetical protein